MLKLNRQTGIAEFSKKGNERLRMAKLTLLIGKMQRPISCVELSVKQMTINILPAAQDDIVESYWFYEQQKEELGRYFKNRSSRISTAWNF